MDQTKTVKLVYSADATGDAGYRSLFDMAADVLKSRDLIRALISRDIKVRYKQTWLGFVWALVPQLVTVALFSFLVSRRVFAMGETELPYVIHAIWSVSFWQLFAVCIINCTNSLTAAGPMIKKISFCREALVFASVGQCLFDFAVRMVPVLLVFIWFGYVPSGQVIWLPFVILFALLMAIGIGFLTSILNLIMRDTASIVSILMTFGIFMAPVLYPPPVKEPFVYINYLNPFSPLLISTQEMLAGTFSPVLPGLIPACVLSVLIFVCGWKLFSLSISRVAEKA